MCVYDNDNEAATEISFLTNPRTSSFPSSIYYYQFSPDLLNTTCRTGNWKKITEIVGTRSCTQIRTHAQKYFIALQKPQHKYDNAGKASKNTQSHGEHASTNNRYTGRVDGSIYGTRPKKSKKLVIGAKHHIGANIRPGSSAIVAGYGGGGTPIHLSGIVPVTSNLIGFNDGNNSTEILSSCQSSQRSSPALALSLIHI